MKNLFEYEYSEYYGYYIKLNPAESILEGLENQMNETISFFNSITAEKLDYQYEKGKWTPKDILQHIIDTERIFTYRALCFSRNDKTQLPGYDENDFATKANASNRAIIDLIEEYKLVKQATIMLFKSFDLEMLQQIGVANHTEISVRAIGYILPGHEIHHLNVIKERYL